MLGVAYGEIDFALQKRRFWNVFDEVTRSRGPGTRCGRRSNGDASKLRNNMKSKGISDHILSAIDTESLTQEKKEARRTDIEAGTNLDNASHARYMDPKLCLRSVNRGHARSSTDKPPRLEEDKMKRVRLQRDIEPGLSVLYGVSMDNRP